MAIKIDIDTSSITQLRQELVSLNKELDSTADKDIAAGLVSEIDKVSEALKQTEVEFAKVRSADFDVATASMRELKAELLNTKNVLASLPEGTAEFAAAAQKAGAIADKMKDVNEQVAVFAAGSNFEVANNQLKGIGDSLLNLDFSKAQEQSASLVNTVSKFSLKGAIESVKQLGSTFINLGKALLSNPLFLLAAAIAGIIAVIVLVLAKLGVLKIAMDALGAAIAFVTDLLEQLTDWLGLTANAEIKTAEAAKVAGEETRAQAEKTAKSKENLYNLTKNLTEEEIRLIEKKTGIEIDSTQSLFDIKQDKLQSDLATYKAEEDALLALEASVEGVTEEQKKRLIELKDLRISTNADIIANEQAKQVAIIKLNQSIDDQLRDFSVKGITDEKKRSKAIIDIRTQEGIEKANIALKEAQLLGDTELVKKIEQLKVAIAQDGFKARDAVDAAAAKAESDRAIQGASDAKARSDKALADKQKAAADGLKILQDANQLELESFIIAEDNKLQTTKDRFAKIKEQAEEEKQYLIENAAALNLVTKQGDDTRLQLQLSAIDQRVAKEGEGVKQVQDKITADTLAAVNARNAAVNAANQTVADTTLSRAEFELASFRGSTEERIKLINQVKDAQLQAIEAEKVAKLAAIQAEIDALSKVPEGGETGEQNAARLAKITQFEAEKAAIEEASRQARLTAETAAAETVATTQAQQREASIAAISEYAAAAQEVIGQLSSIANSVFEQQNTQREERNERELASLEETSAAELSKYEEGTQEYAKAAYQQEVAYVNLKNKQIEADNKAAEEQFNINKSLQIGSAIVAGLQSVLAITSVPDFTFGVVSAIRIAAQAILTASTIAKIKATKFKGTGSVALPKPPAPTAASVSAGAGGATTGGDGGTGGGAAATPAVNLFGQGNNQNTVNASPNVVTGQPNITVTAVVSETEVTATQNRVARMQRSAEL